MTWERFRPSSLILQSAARSARSSASESVTRSKPRIDVNATRFLIEGLPLAEVPSQPLVHKVRYASFDRGVPGRPLVHKYAVRPWTEVFRVNHSFTSTLCV